ncbi:hypothetical protein [Rufibacter soli]
MPHNSFVFVNWVGIQSLETMVMGSNLVLSLLREKSCPGLLNSNRELIGPWEVAVPYLAHKWAPAARELGLRNFAHVLSPGIFGQRSYEKFSQQVQDRVLHVRAFEEQAQAEEWLLLHLV